MKLEQLYYLQEAAKYQSLSLASEKNFISQPAFSASISKLEKELGLKLLQRTNLGVTPTEGGAMILEKIADIFCSVQEIKAIANSQTFPYTVKIAAPPSICDVMLPLTMKKIQERELPLSFMVSAVENHLVYQHVSSGLASLGITTYTDELMKPDLKFTPLFEDQYLLYVGPRCPLWSADCITVQEAMSQPYIAYGEELLAPKANWAKTLFSIAMPKTSLRSDYYNNIRSMVLENNYVAFFPQFSAKSDLYVSNGLLRAQPLVDLPLPAQYGYIESTRYKLSQNDLLFLQLLQEVIVELKLA